MPICLATQLLACNAYHDNMTKCSNVFGRVAAEKLWRSIGKGGFLMALHTAGGSIQSYRHSAGEYSFGPLVAGQEVA